MSRKKKILASLMILILFASVAMVYYIGVLQKKDLAHAARINTNGVIAIPNEKDGERGTLDSPFVLLEIVPTEEYAMLGYYVGGQEPIDVAALEAANYNFNLLSDTLGAFEKLTQKEYNPYTKKMSLYRNKNYFAKYCIGLAYKDDDQTLDVENYYFTGWYQDEACTIPYVFGGKVDSNLDLYAGWSADVIPTPTYVAGTGSGIVLDPAFVGEEMYTITFHANKPSGALDEVTNLPSTIANIPEGNISVDAPSEIPKLRGNIDKKVADYHIQVITVTPEELNNNLGLIDRADLIAMIPKTYFSDNAFVNLFRSYKRSDLFSSVGTKKTFFKNDLTWEATIKIFEKVAIDEHKTPLIYDYSYFDTAVSTDSGRTSIQITSQYANGWTYQSQTVSASRNNMYKLYLMLQQMKPTLFYNAYLKTGLVKPVQVIKLSGGSYINVIGKYNVPMTTGSFLKLSGMAATYWAAPTFLPISASYDYYDSSKVFADLGIDYDFNHKQSVNVLNNVYSFSGDNNLTFDFNKPAISNTARTKEAFLELYKNRIGELNSNTKIRPVDAIYYLLRQSSSNNVTPTKKELNILEIQPSNSFRSDTDWFWSIMRIVPEFTGDIKVTKQTTAEFVGKMEDMNSLYDMVYIGLRDDSLDDKMRAFFYKSYWTKYYYTYYHEGAEATVKNDLLGMFGGDTDKDNTTRYPGNDITKVKLEALKQFANAGYPILFADGFFTDATKQNVNTDKVAKATNLYELAQIEDIRTSLFYDISLEKEELAKAMTKNHLTLNLLEQPISYKDRKLATYQGLSDSEVYINGSHSKDKGMAFKFYISEGNSSSHYTVRLYMDDNADGRFDLSTESLGSLEIYDDTLKKYVRYDELVVGHTYTLIRLVEEYVGVLPWKLEIVQNDNMEIRSMKSGICAIKAEVDEHGNKKKEELKVLQIISDTGNNVFLPTDDEISKLGADNNFYGLVKYGGANVSSSVTNITKKFWEYTKDLEDFRVHFTRLTVNEYQKQIDSNEDLLDNYNMLIIGFADMYSDISDEKALEKIEDFIDDGKTVLFTHDTTSFINVSKSKYSGSYWGYHINQYFRDKLGMDRFGVTLQYPKNGDPAISLQDCLILKKDAAYINESLQSQLQTYEKDIQGFNYATIKRYLASNAEGNQTTTSVSNVNYGQITKYPYEIPDTFKVANTHAQYYQLDLEGEDIVVWYCLSGSSSWYNYLPNDVRNNYYIYNRGNITYSGVGHSGGLSDDEVKLFVNTMIAAYNASAAPMEVIIHNEEKSSDSSGNDFLYVDYDALETDIALGQDINSSGGIQTKRIYFELQENSIVSNKKIAVTYALSVGGVEEALTLVTKRKANGAEVSTNDVKTLEVYYVDVPITKLNGVNSISFLIKADMTYGKRQEKKKETKKEVTIFRRGLFHLE